MAVILDTADGSADYLILRAIELTKDGKLLKAITLLAVAEAIKHG